MFSVNLMQLPDLKNCRTRKLFPCAGELYSNMYQEEQACHEHGMSESYGEFLALSGQPREKHNKHERERRYTTAQR